MYLKNFKEYIRKIVPVCLLVGGLYQAAGAVPLSNSAESATIEMPAIPSSLTSPGERADFLICHFWDNMKPGDLSLPKDQPILEQSFADFLSILPYATSDSIVSEGFSNLLDKVREQKELGNQFSKLAETYLYSFDSPFFSETSYIAFLNAKASLDATDVERLRLLDEIEQINKNMVGKEAADFSFTLLDGSQSSLRESLPKEGGEMMLIFFDPECEQCEEVMGRIMKHDELTKAIDAGKLNILAVYSGDNERSWKKKAQSLPASWTIGINSGEIDDEELYYLPSMPTIYLLDSQGRVKQKNIWFY